MDITFHFHNIESSEALKQASRKVIDKLAPQFNRLIGATVRFKVEKVHQIAEITMNGDGGVFIAEEKTTDMYGSLDLVEKKLERQIKKHKGKQQAHHTRQK
ncbi:MAG: ribosome-associated translation inhibitor RaiA [Leptonema sp. (in: Bacteria)]|nr:ribosome-associated translation inhibitor RaiA [Leptonema sp. (in: bacteria)]